MSYLIDAMKSNRRAFSPQKYTNGVDFIDLNFGLSVRCKLVAIESKFAMSGGPEWAGRIFNLIIALTKHSRKMIEKTIT